MNISLAKERTIEMLRHYGLTGWTFDWTNAKSFVGDCNYRLQRVRLSIEYTRLNDEDEVMNTIAHEVAHALTRGAKHGPRWKNMMCTMGYKSNRVAPATVKMPEEKWLIVCEKCGKVIGQRTSRRMDLSTKRHKICGGDLCWATNPNYYD